MSKNKIKVYKGGLEKNKGVYMEDFLDEFRDVGQENLFQGIQLDFDLHYKEREQKIVPVIQIAEESDAEPIVNIFKEIYKDTYPYREFYDLGEVLKMIRDPKYLFVTFKMNQSIAGFYNAQLDFVNKRGYTGRLVLKKKWHGRIDVLKAALVSMSALYFTFKDKISVWYGETRTAHTKSQFVTSACGLKPIAFFPNKDRFLHKIESDLMQILYSREAIEKCRVRKIPMITPQVSDSFIYSTLRYNLGPVIYQDPHIDINMDLILDNRRQIEKKVSRDQFGYEWIEMNLSKTASYLKFLYTPHLDNIEKMEYQVQSKEELMALIQELKQFIKEKKIRYCECFVSAYKPSHQKIFLLEGFLSRGYVPSWFYKKDKDAFEDAIVFNKYIGDLSDNLHLIEEGEELVNLLIL